MADMTLLVSAQQPSKRILSGISVAASWVIFNRQCGIFTSDQATLPCSDHLVV